MASLLIIAMARPQSSTNWEESTTEGIDIVLAIDISGSMLAQDLKPDRLEASKNVAMSLNNINMQISTIHQKINQLLPKPEEVKIPQPPLPPNKEEIDPNPTVPVEETTSN